MNTIFAKIKKTAGEKLPSTDFKLVSDISLFTEVKLNVAHCIDYSTAHNLDEDSWFKIEQFSTTPYAPAALKKPLDSKDYNELDKKHFSHIKYIFATQDKDVYFQKITPSLFISKKKFIQFGDIATVEPCNDRLIINELPDAIYYSDSDTLAFKSLATISSIFKGIDELYREATKPETEKFLNSEFIQLKDGYKTENVSKPNRKRIALALDTLNKLSQEDKREIFNYISEYCLNKLNFDKEANTFEISNDDELKLLLYGIEQRFYTTPVSKQQRLANSIQILNVPAAA